jgi:hypothetical protein
MEAILVVVTQLVLTSVEGVVEEGGKDDELVSLRNDSILLLLSWKYTPK